LPDYDDKDWRLISVPGSWQSQGIKSENNIGWYRIYFSASDFYNSANFQSLGISLGRIGNADELFFNGVKIGGHGIIGDNYVEMELKFRLYKIPKEILKQNQINLIAVRVMNTYRSGGILYGPVCIGLYGDLLDEKYRNDFSRKIAEIAIFSLLIISLLCCIFLYTTGIRESEYLSFGIFLFIYIITFILDTLIFYETGMKTVFVQKIINALYISLPGIAIIFIFHIFKEPIQIWTKSITILFVFMASLMLFPFSYKTMNLLIMLWIIPLLATIGISLYFSIKAYRKKYYESGDVLTGIIGLSGGGIFECVSIVYPIFFENIHIMEKGLSLFLFSMMYALIARHSRIQKNLNILSGRILEAHEEERKRLSREIHDGLGQPLLAIKLHLQMIQAETIPAAKESFPMLIEELSSCIRELKEMAIDLRPATLENLKFYDLLKWYARKFHEKTGISVEITGDEFSDLPLKTKDHLYRICQEAFSNIAKHAEADLIHVIAEKKGRFFCLTIQDNGHGFNLSEITLKNKGIGLSTMKERTELLGGFFHIQSSQGKGTLIQIEIKP